MVTRAFRVSTSLPQMCCAVVVVLLLTSNLSTTTTNSSPSSSILNPQMGDSCTIFTVSIGDRVYFGNNEDYRLWGINAWFVPAQTISTLAGDSSIYGAVFFGFDDNDDPADGYPQGGMNDQGLCMDGNGLSYYSLNPHPERLNQQWALLAEVLWVCATVDEVEAWFLTHNIGSTMNYQLHFADATGDAVVISAGPDQELAFTQIGVDTCLVSTNINVADPTRDVFDCWRYSTAMAMLTVMHSASDLTVEACRDVLAAVHQDGTYATKYSNVFDCVSHDIYLWYDRDYTQAAVMNLDSELAAVIPGATGYYEEDPLFGAFDLDGNICYRKVAITELFATSVPSPPLQLIFFVVGAIVGIVAISTVILYLRKRR
ncbi:MAG: hypothetical protein Q6361_04005 [Candidatus Hermodarchaeota archaeon]|nr:hypothetical protein [Candidatus Hermodarchaeota archaeon]